jgi:CheY-like chemotaxis protein
MAPVMKKILLVDDDDHLLLTLGDYLSYEGFDVSTARSGEEALAALEKDAPDLIVLDIGMPGMGGLGFLKERDEANQTGAIPILVFTARSTMESFFDNVEVDAFLAKPRREEDLLRKIKEILARRDAVNKAASRPARNVLLVEDDFEVVQEVSRMFRQGQDNLTLRVSPTASDAVEKAATVRPDLVLTKEVLRGMNGDELALLLRQMPKTHDVPVLLYDNTRLYDGTREIRYRQFGRTDRYVGSLNGADLYQSVCQALGI